MFSSNYHGEEILNYIFLSPLLFFNAILMISSILLPVTLSYFWMRSTSCLENSSSLTCSSNNSSKFSDSNATFNTFVVYSEIFYCSINFTIIKRFSYSFCSFNILTISDKSFLYRLPDINFIAIRYSALEVRAKYNFVYPHSPGIMAIHFPCLNNLSLPINKNFLDTISYPNKALFYLLSKYQ